MYLIKLINKFDNVITIERPYIIITITSPKLLILRSLSIIREAKNTVFYYVKYDSTFRGLFLPYFI